MLLQMAKLFPSFLWLSNSPLCMLSCCWVASVVSDSVRPHRRQPTRHRCPWDSPDKNTGVGCHFLPQFVKVKSLSHVWLFVTRWTAAYQAPPSMGFSRQEYWSGVPLPSPHCVYIGTQILNKLQCTFIFQISFDLHSYSGSRAQDCLL